jgi:UDP-N-acetylmuramoyl-tripeptide--D-alanyl-D-alanine ligase
VIKGSNKIILDAYNANPSSMKVAIENFLTQESENKYLFLGAMMELGEFSLDEHATIIDQLIASGLTNTVLVGGDFGKINHPFLYFENADNAAIWAKENCPENSMILIKGSRSTKMEKIMQAL